MSKWLIACLQVFINDLSSAPLLQRSADRLMQRKCVARMRILLLLLLQCTSEPWAAVFGKRSSSLFRNSSRRRQPFASFQFRLNHSCTTTRFLKETVSFESRPRRFRSYVADRTMTDPPFVTSCLCSSRTESSTGRAPRGSCSTDAPTCR